jgi:Tetracyclin repressor-like, C-terminal domain
MSLLSLRLDGSTGKFGVDDVLSLSSSNWDKKIAADLIAEMEIHLVDRVTTLPEVRRMLAVKGYDGLRRRIESDVKDKSGVAALRTMAHSMRDFALEHPGLSAATFRSATTDSLEWRLALSELSRTALRVFAQIGLEGEPAQQALRMLRSLIRGFVLNEMVGSFLESFDYKVSFELAIDAFVVGLSAFRVSSNSPHHANNSAPVAVNFT